MQLKNSSEIINIQGFLVPNEKGNSIYLRLYRRQGTHYHRNTRASRPIFVISIKATFSIKSAIKCDYSLKAIDILVKQLLSFSKEWIKKSFEC